MADFAHQDFASPALEEESSTPKLADQWETIEASAAAITSGLQLVAGLELVPGLELTP